MCPHLRLPISIFEDQPARHNFSGTRRLEASQPVDVDEVGQVSGLDRERTVRRELEQAIVRELEAAQISVGNADAVGLQRAHGSLTPQ